jgi:hypothetical protein
MKEEIYHVYVGNKCIEHSLSKREFEKIWSLLKNLKDFLHTKMEISYECLEKNSAEILNSSY